MFWVVLGLSNICLGSGAGVIFRWSFELPCISLKSFGGLIWRGWWCGDSTGDREWEGDLGSWARIVLEILGTIPKLHTNIVLPIILAGYITYSLALKLILF